MMPAMPTENDIRKHLALYQEGLKAMGLSDQKEKMEHYMGRLREMYASQQFKAHNVYPTMNVSSIYAVIAMCL